MTNGSQWPNPTMSVSHKINLRNVLNKQLTFLVQQVVLLGPWLVTLFVQTVKMVKIIERRWRTGLMAPQSIYFVGESYGRLFCAKKINLAYFSCRHVTDGSCCFLRGKALDRCPFRLNKLQLFTKNLKARDLLSIVCFSSQPGESCK